MIESTELMYTYTALLRQELHATVHIQTAAGVLSSLVSSACSPSGSSRDHLQLGVQRAPLVRGGGQPAIHLAGDGKPVHLQGAALGCGQLRVPSEEHCDQRQGPEPTNTPDSENRW